jgi:hypothetical protein
MDVLGLLSTPLLFFQLFSNPVFEVGNRVAADAELDEMKRHY